MVRESISSDAESELLHDSAVLSPRASSTIFFVTGEPSGDFHGSLLVEALNRLHPHLQLLGIGGPRLARAGMSLLTDSTRWATYGASEAVRVLGRAMRGYRAIKQWLARCRPDVVVLIDFGFFNRYVARSARRLGLRILYYFPPKSWSRSHQWRPWLNDVDRILTPFPWSYSLLSHGSVQVDFVGHPVVDVARPTEPLAAARTRLSLTPLDTLIALAPGSRAQELRLLLPCLAKAAAILQKNWPMVRFVMPIAPGIDGERVKANLRREGLEVTLLEGMDYNTLQACSLALVASGTATLEFACLGVPMVVVYRLPSLVGLQGEISRQLVPEIRQLRFAAMPNIVADRLIVPELMHRAATPFAIAEAALTILGNPTRRAQMQHDLAEVVKILGPPGASERAAQVVLEMLGIPGARSERQEMARV